MVGIPFLSDRAGLNTSCLAGLQNEAPSPWGCPLPQLPHQDGAQGHLETAHLLGGSGITVVHGALQRLPAPEVHTLEYGGHAGLEDTGQDGRRGIRRPQGHARGRAGGWHSISKLGGSPQRPQGAKEGWADEPQAAAWDPSPPGPCDTSDTFTEKPHECRCSPSAPSAISQHWVPSAALPGPTTSRSLEFGGLAATPQIPSPQISLTPSPAVTRPLVSGLCWGWATGRYLNGRQGRRLGCLLPQEEGQQPPRGPLCHAGLSSLWLLH